MKLSTKQRRDKVLQRRFAALQDENRRLRSELTEAEEFFGSLRLSIPKDASNNN